MRHFLLPGAVAMLAFGVGATTASAGLVALTGGAHTAAASLFGARRGAIAIAAITVAADQHGSTAARTQVASSGEVHWRMGPMGIDDNARFVKYYAGNVAAVWAAGRDSGTGLVVGAGVAPAFPLASQCFTVSALSALPTAARNRQTTVAAQSARRKPCKQQTVKPV